MALNDFPAQISAAAEFISARVSGRAPRALVILGSGVGGSIPTLEDAVEINSSDIPHFPRGSVAGHSGRLFIGRVAGKEVAILSGRTHYYEGLQFTEMSLPLRALIQLGVKTLIATAAVGSLRKKIRPGDFTIVTDHMNFMGHNPLVGLHGFKFGPMFPDLRGAYDAKLGAVIKAACKRARVKAHEGIYVAVSGPSYETPAEVRAYTKLGGDVVGMSVVPEIISARQLGVRCAAIAWSSNMAAGLPGSVLNHDDVLALGAKVAQQLKAVLNDTLAKLPA